MGKTCEQTTEVTKEDIQIGKQADGMLFNAISQRGMQI